MIKQKIVAATLALSVVASGVLADSTLGEQSTRLESMQLNNYMTKDRSNIFFNPANIANFKTSAFLEIGNAGGNGSGGATAVDASNGAIATDGYAGMFFDGGSIGNFGVVLNRANQSGYFAAPGSNSTEKNNIDLFYGIALSDAINVGARLTYATMTDNIGDSSADVRVFQDANTTTGAYNLATVYEDSNSDDKAASDMTIELGVQASGFDATFTYGMYDESRSIVGNPAPLNGLNDKTTTYGGTALDNNVTNILINNDKANIDADGASLMEFALAYTLDLDAKSTLTAYGVYSSEDTSTKSSWTNSQTDTDYNENNNTVSQTVTTDLAGNDVDSIASDTIILGAAYNLKPSDNVLLVVAAEYTNWTQTTSYTDTLTKDTTITKVFTASTTDTVYGTLGQQGTADDYEETASDISVVVAVEALVTDKLTLRFGLRESVYSSYEDSTDNDNIVYGTTFTNNDADTATDSTPLVTANDTSENVVDNTDTITNEDNQQDVMQIALGFGYQATKEISIDGLVNYGLLLDGPQFISGAANNVNARLAVNYNF